MVVIITKEKSGLNFDINISFNKKYILLSHLYFILNSFSLDDKNWVFILYLKLLFLIFIK